MLLRKTKSNHAQGSDEFQKLIFTVLNEASDKNIKDFVAIYIYK